MHVASLGCERCSSGVHGKYVGCGIWVAEPAINLIFSPDEKPSPPLKTYIPAILRILLSKAQRVDFKVEN